MQLVHLPFRLGSCAAEPFVISYYTRWKFPPTTGETGDVTVVTGDPTAGGQRFGGLR